MTAGQPQGGAGPDEMVLSVMRLGDPQSSVDDTQDRAWVATQGQDLASRQCGGGAQVWHVELRFTVFSLSFM